MKKSCLVTFVLLFFIGESSLLNPTSKETRKKLTNVFSQCDTRNFFTNPDSMKKMVRGELSYDPDFKRTILCMSKKLGYMKDDGSLDAKATRENWKEMYGKEEMGKLEPCLIQKENPEDTALDLYKCKIAAVGDRNMFEDK